MVVIISIFIETPRWPHPAKCTKKSTRAPNTKETIAAEIWHRKNSASDTYQVFEMSQVDSIPFAMTLFPFRNKTDEFLNKRGIVWMSSRSACSPRQGPSIWSGLQQKLFVGHYYGIFVVWRGGRPRPLR